MIHLIEEHPSARTPALNTLNAVRLGNMIHRAVADAQDALLMEVDPKQLLDYNSRLYEMVRESLSYPPGLLNIARGSLNYVIRNEGGPKHTRTHEVRATFSNGKPNHVVARIKGLSWRKAKRWAASVKESSLVIDFTLNPKSAISHNVVVSTKVSNKRIRPTKTK